MSKSKYVKIGCVFLLCFVLLTGCSSCKSSERSPSDMMSESTAGNITTENHDTSAQTDSTSFDIQTSEETNKQTRGGAVSSRIADTEITGEEAGEIPAESPEIFEDYF